MDGSGPFANNEHHSFCNGRLHVNHHDPYSLDHSLQSFMPSLCIYTWAPGQDDADVQHKLFEFYTCTIYRSAGEINWKVPVAINAVIIADLITSILHSIILLFLNTLSHFLSKPGKNWVTLRGICCPRINVIPVAFKAQTDIGDHWEIVMGAIISISID